MTAFTHKQLWESVADQLRDEILDGRLPAGSRLVETELAERFGVSRGPIRDALAELAAGGPRRGPAAPRHVRAQPHRDATSRRSTSSAGRSRRRPSASRSRTRTDDDIAEMYAALDEAERAYAAGRPAARLGGGHGLPPLATAGCRATGAC